MKKTLALVLSLAMLLAASTAMAAVEIDYWSVFTGGDGATMQGMVDAFNASQDEVHVNHTPMTADDLYQKIPMTVQTGSGVPDVAVVHIERIPNFVTNEMLYATPPASLPKTTIRLRGLLPTSTASITASHWTSTPTSPTSTRICSTSMT